MPHRAGHIPPVESGSYPVREGCAVRPWVDGEPAFRRICEAVEAARRSVWVTVAFLERDVQMPDGRGTFFDVLDAGRGPRRRRARHLLALAGAGGARAGRPLLGDGGGAQLARPARRALRRALGSPARRALPSPEELARRRRAAESEVAFVGGINLDGSSVSGRGHAPRGVRRRPRRLPRAARAGGDRRAPQLRAALERGERARPGPTATGRRGATRGRCSSRRGSRRRPATFPSRSPAPCSAGCYRDGTPAPGARPFAIAERRVQRPRPVPRGDRRGAAHDLHRGPGDRVARAVVAALKQALERGVEVVFLVPGNCHPGLRRGASATRT